jgi:hypothetical protein
VAISFNGWTAVRFRADPRLRLIRIPGTKRTVTLARSAAPLFAAFLHDWDDRMPARLKLDKGPVDGWAYRPSRLEKGLSNHASGSAVDVRYDVLKPDGKSHMTAAEKKVLDGILKEYVTPDGHRVLANGAWWNAPHIDEMHTELSQDWDRGAKRNTTSADVASAIKHLGIDKDGVRKK